MKIYKKSYFDRWSRDVKDSKFGDILNYNGLMYKQPFLSNKDNYAYDTSSKHHFIVLNFEI